MTTINIGSTNYGKGIIYRGEVGSESLDESQKIGQAANVTVTVEREPTSQFHFKATLTYDPEQRAVGMIVIGGPYRPERYRLEIHLPNYKNGDQMLVLPFAHRSPLPFNEEYILLAQNNTEPYLIVSSTHS